MTTKKSTKRASPTSSKLRDSRIKNDIAIVLGGEAGQGVQSIESILVSILKKEGFHVFATKEYMSRVRGGVNTTEIRVSGDPVRAHVDRIDILVALNDGVVPHLGKRVGKHTLVLGDGAMVRYPALVSVPLEKIAGEIGNPIYLNTVAAGLLCGLLAVREETLIAGVTLKFAGKGAEMASKNREAAARGYERGAALRARGLLETSIARDPAMSGRLMINGADAVAFGALAGGCNACFAYPMTPSTSVFTSLAESSKTMDIVVEQVEDEIGVINMALGAWYAGARALVTTSGGGFALMTEGVSLAGMMESPAVIHLAQRPGPATGLPTRTAQGDLNLALYAGHGYFPRIILAPGSTEEAFALSQRAFDLADRFQVPVFIMTDQYFVDSYYDIPEIYPDESHPRTHIVQTLDDYRRYMPAKNGISPRGVPGFGSGFVCADSDAHDAEGRITEDLDGVHLQMVEKRRQKALEVRRHSLKPVLIGPKKYKNLVVSWGSNYYTIIEALAFLKDSATAFLHFPQVYPLHRTAGPLLSAAKNILCVECNETGQFADLLRLETGIEIRNRLLKFNGMPFSVEEIASGISGFGKGKRNG